MASTGELRLDPGPQTRRRVKLNWKCIAISFIGMVVLSGALIVFQIIRISLLSEDVGMLGEMYQDLTVPYTSREIVRPLVDGNQTFDIVVTVWLRQDEPKTALVGEGGPILLEKAIYSDTIFRGVHLNDKNLKTVVQLRIPTEVFKVPEIWTYDLRASFVLIPNSPSPLDYAVNYTSWIPAVVHHPPMRSYPEGYTPSLADHIIDSYGTFLPLIHLDSVKSICPSSLDAQPKRSDDANDETNEIFDLNTQQNILPFKRDTWRYKSTKRKSALEVHPHIISRSHLRVGDMTKLFNRTEYEQKHRKLRATSCGQEMNDILDWRLCWRFLDINQNTETRIKLRKQDLLTGQNTTEWAYAPYLSLSESAWGPLDLMKVPVIREDCVGNRTRSFFYNQDFMNIPWNISFSGLTPGKIQQQDRMGLAMTAFNSKAGTLEEKVNAQKSLDFINSLTGQKTNADAHPKRHLTLLAIRTVLSTIVVIVELYYWFTRVSTIGLSVPGTLLIGGGSLLDMVIQVVLNSKGYKSFGTGWVVRVLLSQLPRALAVLFMFKAALRAELHWYTKWIPGLRIARPTHLERASERLETKVSWVYKTAAYVILAIACTYYSDLHFLSSTNIGAVGSTKIPSTLRAKMGTLLITPSITLGRGLQLLLNYHARTFAGTYRITGPLILIANLCTVSMSLSHVVGTLKNDAGVPVSMTANLLYAIMLIWQAARYSSVVTLEEDENEK